MKRMKVFATLGALCISIFALILGVYAATQVTYNIDAVIKYSFDDAIVEITSTVYGYNLTTPTTASTKYNGPINMPENDTLFKAVLVNAGGRYSGVTTRNYILEIAESEE